MILFIRFILTAGIACLAAQSAEAKGLADMALCFGKPIESLSLASQFPPTQDQGPRNTCYSFAPPGPVSAAIFRYTGKRFTIPGNFSACQVFSGKEVETQKSLIKQTVKQNLDSPFDVGTPRTALELILKSTQVPKLAEMNTHFNKMVKVPGVVEMKFKGQSKAQIYERQIEKGLAKIPHLPAVRVDLKDYKIASEPVDWDLGEHITDLTWAAKGKEIHTFPYESEDCKSDSPDTRALIEKIFKAMCAGFPVLAQAYDSKILTSEDGGKTIKRDSRPLDESGHVIALSGFTYLNGEPTLVAMNSWAAGTKKMPHKSLAYIPFKEICRLHYEMMLVRHESEPNPWEKDTECALSSDKAMRCQKIKYLPEGVIVPGPRHVPK